MFGKFQFFEEGCFSFILGYTIFTLILIIRKFFKKKSRLNIPFYSIIFVTLIISKSALEPANSNLQSQRRKCFTKDFVLVEVLDLWNRLHNSDHHSQDCFIGISVLKYKNYFKFLPIVVIIIWLHKFKSWSYIKQCFPVFLENFWK